MAQALKGIRVLDLSTAPPGAVCTMILGDLGAQVLKIETPRRPGEAPRYGFSAISPSGEENRKRAAHYAANRNKRSMALNLKSREGQEIFYRLCRRYDVLIEGFKPGTVKRLGIDYATIRKINPAIIYCSISGYGQTGPYRDLMGHDLNYISLGGVLSLIGERGGRPVAPLNLVADLAGGSFPAVISILAALVARQQTGKGQYADIALMDGVIASLVAVPGARDYLYTGVVPKRGETDVGCGFPCVNVYDTSDRKYISLACPDARSWEKLCRLFGKEEFVAHQWDTGAKREEMFGFFRSVFATRTRADWFESLKRDDINVAKVLTLDEVFVDPQVLHRGMLMEFDDPRVGRVRQIGSPFKLARTPPRVRSLSPLLGEHTDEVLRELGCSFAEINNLRDAGAVG